MTCAHDTCTCLVDDAAGFCSAECRNASEAAEGFCPCGHAECAASHSEVPLT